MSLQPDSRLGPYEVISPIAAGGMGQVFKAKDTRLERAALFQTGLLDAMWVEAGMRAQYDVAPDGESFIFVQYDRAAGPTPIYVVLDWLT